jgi:PAS domain S-box-containing protein
MASDSRHSNIVTILAFSVILVILVIAARFNFLLFHTLAELFAVLVAWSLFVILWHTRHLVENRALVFLGIAYLFVGGIDLVHTLSYKGMGFLGPESGANPATQLWLLARYMESISLCVFPFLFSRQVNPFRVFVTYGFITGAGLLAILYWDIFPVCYVDGTGLTGFKIASEYIICLVLGAALVFLHRNRAALDAQVYRYMVISILFTIGAELAFTFYVSVYGLSNLIGHFFKIVSFYCIYRALVHSCLTQPQTVLFSRLKHSEERYRALIDFSPMPLLVTQDEKIVFVNPAAVEAFGIKDPAEIIGTTPDDWLDPDDAKTARQRRAELMEKKQALAPAELVLNRKDGRQITVLANISRIIHNGASALMSVFQDITERKRSETEREALQAQLNHARKMESIGAMAGGIAHDFNNILYPVIGLSEMLVEDLSPGSPEQQDAREILTAARRGQQLVQRILSFSRGSAPRLIPLHIQRIIKEVLTLSRAAIPAEITLSSDIRNDCPQVLADPVQIHQVVMNLVTNARHAIESGSGTISVQLKPTTLSPGDYPALELSAGRYVMLSVSDTGTGIDPGIVNRIFDPYFTTREKGKGTGLGLATVYGIIKKHGGDITVNSDPGKGACFSIFLPAADENLSP